MNLRYVPQPLFNDRFLLFLFLEAQGALFLSLLKLISDPTLKSLIVAPTELWIKNQPVQNFV